MPQTESERLKSGRHQQQREQREEPDARTQPKDSASPQLCARTTVTQCSSEEEGRPLLQRVSLCPQLSQHRPSVLRQGVQAAHVRPQAPCTLTEASSAQPISLCKVEVDTGSRGQSSPPHSEHSPGPTRHPSPPRTASPKQSSIITRQHEAGHPTLEGSSALFLNGLCCWPGCDAVFEEFPSFLKHLHSDHGHGDRSIAQWKVQQDMVQYMETQLTVEKQKLFAMQLHLHLSGHKSTVLKTASDWPYRHSLSLGLPQNRGGVSRCTTKEPEELVQHEYWPSAAPHHLRPDLIPSVECYKYNNIRPLYTYACMIRWSILESPDKQRSLNDIYNWFTTMFFYFRHNTATWKNAVRHNLSLHKCFVRVEGGKGAVWTVDEMEYQRRKGQKYHRDHHVKWLSPYSLFRPEEP
ncbi:forkhead box protein P1-like isoform X3 [Oncorhynchus nerka]|uniref:forkhead box protein P1-like isoform X3 n=1 Tax=Oncorhynchus nerka TaxID=8023 RepID=UPI001130370A|nr:forkhead box protein P1-like isoform X3 [Oncorhynchus nerka]